MTGPPDIPKEVILPFFDKEEDVPSDMATSDIATLNKLNAEIDVYKYRLIVDHNVNDINREGHRKMIPQPNGWVEMYYIHGNLVIVVKVWAEQGGLQYLVSHPKAKSETNQA